MRTIAPIISRVALFGTIAPALLDLGGALSRGAVKWWTLARTAGWFVTVPVWMDRAAQA